MGPTRFPYGQALGFANQFNFTVGPVLSGTQGLISGSTAPNVTLGNLFYVNNTGNLTINNFLLDDTANRIAQYEGKVIRIFALDTGSTSFANTSPLFLSGTNGVLNQNGSIEFMFSRGSWFELDRTYGGNNVNTLVTNVGSSLNVNGLSVVFVNNTGSTTNKIIALSGGYVGQEITFMNVGSNLVQFIGQAGGATSSNMVFINTNSMIIMASGAFKLVKHLDLNWRAIAVGSANWANG